MMHPQIYDIIARIRHHGHDRGADLERLLLSGRQDQKLNEAGLDYLQISIDKSRLTRFKKDLKVLDAKLVNLSAARKFKVNINSVVGGGVANPDEALIIANRCARTWLHPLSASSTTKWASTRPNVREKRL